MEPIGSSHEASLYLNVAQASTHVIIFWTFTVLDMEQDLFEKQMPASI